MILLTRFFLIILSVLYFICSVSMAQAASATTATQKHSSIWTRKNLFGHLGGLRPKLASHGITFSLRISQFYQGVASGGVNTNSEYGGKGDYIINVNGHKLGLWKGLGLNLHAETQFGRSILRDAGAFALPNTPMLYPLPSDQSTALTGWVFSQQVSKKISLFAGKLHALDLWTMLYPHVGEGLDGFMNLNSLTTGLPWLRWVNLSMLGAGGWMVNDKNQIQAGLIFIDTHNATTTSGFDQLGDDGVSFLGLYRVFFDVADKPGSFLFAAGGSTRKYTSLDKSDWFIIPGEGLGIDKIDGVWSAAIYYDQIVWQAPQNSKRNLRLFTSLTVSDGNPSFSRWGFLASLEGSGLLSSRPGDKIGIAGFYNGLSNEFKNTASVLRLSLQDIWGIELYYNLEITPWSHFTANMQFVRNQNEKDSVAVIPGARLVIDL